MRSVHEFEIDRPLPVIAGQSFDGPVWDSAGSASVGQGDTSSAIEQLCDDLDQSRMLHHVEHPTLMNVDQAEYEAAERAASDDDRHAAELRSGAHDVGEPDRLSADCMRRRR